MELTEKNKVTVYRYDGQYGTSYSIGLSKKKQDGSYEKGFIPIKFKKGVELENKTEIYIQNAWLTFNLKDKKTYPYVFINEFKTAGQELNTPSSDEAKENIDQIYEDFGNKVELDDDDLPF